MFFSKLAIVAFTIASAVIAAPAPAKLQSRAPRVNYLAARQDDTYNPDTNSWSCQGPAGWSGCDADGAAYTCEDDGNGGFVWTATGGNC